METLTASKNVNDAVKSVLLSDDIHRQGPCKPAADATIDELLARNQAAYAHIAGEIVSFERTINNFNAMSACAIGGCKIMRAGPID